jgi:hypothetical protein
MMVMTKKKGTGRCRLLRLRLRLGLCPLSSRPLAPHSVDASCCCSKAAARLPLRFVLARVQSLLRAAAPAVAQPPATSPDCQAKGDANLSLSPAAAALPHSDGGGGVLFRKVVVVGVDDEVVARSEQADARPGSKCDIIDELIDEDPDASRQRELVEDSRQLVRLSRPFAHPEAPLTDGAARAMSAGAEACAADRTNGGGILMPTEEEVHRLASYLGMDVRADADCLWIAEEALLAPLPEGWAVARDEKQRAYYVNKAENISQWAHPLDAVYVALFHKTRAATRPSAAAELLAGDAQPRPIAAAGAWLRRKQHVLSSAGTAPAGLFVLAAQAAASMKGWQWDGDCAPATRLPLPLPPDVPRPLVPAVRMLCDGGCRADGARAALRPDDVERMARYLGLVLPDDAALAWLAKVACLAPVPSPWRVGLDPDGGAFFLHPGLSLVSLHHPLDAFFGSLIAAERMVMSQAEDDGSGQHASAPGSPHRTVSGTAGSGGWCEFIDEDTDAYFHNFCSGTTTYVRPWPEWCAGEKFGAGGPADAASPLLSLGGLPSATLLLQELRRASAAPIGEPEASARPPMLLALPHVAYLGRHELRLCALLVRQLVSAQSARLVTALSVREAQTDLEAELSIRAEAAAAQVRVAASSASSRWW